MTEPRRISAGGVWTEYSSVNPWSHDNQWLLLVHNDHYGLYHGNGSFVGHTPLRADSYPRWSLHDHHVYYQRGNQLRKWYTVDADSLVRAFDEYDSISNKGEADISEDGDYLVYCGDNRFIFTYQISTGRVGRSLDTGEHPFDSIYMTPDNNVLVSWDEDGDQRFQGIELFDRDMNFMHHVTTTGGHMDVGRKGEGDECLFWCNSDDRVAPVAANAVVELRLRDGHEIPRLTLPWHLGMHICYVPGFVFVDSYTTIGDGVGVIYQINLNTGHIVELAYHGSIVVQGDSTSQPKVVASRDGSRVAWTRNFGGERSVWMMDLDTTPAPSPTVEPTIAGTIVKGNYIELYGKFPPNVKVKVMHRSGGQVNLKLET